MARAFVDRNKLDNGDDQRCAGDDDCKGAEYNVLHRAVLFEVGTVVEALGLGPMMWLLERPARRDSS